MAAVAACQGQEEALKRCEVKVLKAFCRSAALPVSGNKTQLVARIQLRLQQLQQGGASMPPPAKKARKQPAPASAAPAVAAAAAAPEPGEAAAAPEPGEAEQQAA